MKESIESCEVIQHLSKDNYYDIFSLNEKEIQFLSLLTKKGHEDFKIDSMLIDKTCDALSILLGSFDEKEINQILSSLLGKKIVTLEKEIIEKTLCPICAADSARILFSCTNCSSNLISKYEKIQHDYCGYNGEKKLFTRNDKLVCPKCNLELEKQQLDPDENMINAYRVIEAYYICENCKTSMDAPKIEFECIDCNSVYDHITSSYLIKNRYKIKDSIVKELLNRKKINLLIIEDFSPQANVTAWLLQNTSNIIDYDIAISENGKDALLALEEKEFQIVLLDLGLPDIDGLELLKQIKSKWPNTIVLVLTGREDVEVVIKAMKSGAKEFLLKKDDMTETLPSILEEIVREITKIK